MVCLCSLLDINFYSNNLSTIATISLLIISELFPACFHCRNCVDSSHNSLGSDDKINVFQTPEAESLKSSD